MAPERVPSSWEVGHAFAVNQFRSIKNGTRFFLAVEDETEPLGLRAIFAGGTKPSGWCRDVELCAAAICESSDLPRN
jgi:hypothetical protein